MSQSFPDIRDSRSTIDRESDLVTSAVDLVASGGATAVMVAGLRLAAAAAEVVAPHARAVGVILERVVDVDAQTIDIRVRRRGLAVVRSD